MRPNEVIIHDIIESIVGVVDEIRYFLREGSIQHKRPLIISSNILDRKMKVMHVNDRDKGSKGTENTPRAEPK